MVNVVLILYIHVHAYIHTCSSFCGGVFVMIMFHISSLLFQKYIHITCIAGLTLRVLQRPFHTCTMNWIKSALDAHLLRSHLMRIHLMRMQCVLIESTSGSGFEAHHEPHSSTIVESHVTRCVRLELHTLVDIAGLVVTNLLFLCFTIYRLCISPYTRIKCFLLSSYSLDLSCLHLAIALLRIT